MLAPAAQYRFNPAQCRLATKHTYQSPRASQCYSPRDIDGVSATPIGLVKPGDLAYFYREASAAPWHNILYSARQLGSRAKTCSLGLGLVSGILPSLAPAWRRARPRQPRRGPISRHPEWSFKYMGLSVPLIGTSAGTCVDEPGSERASTARADPPVPWPSRA